MSVLQDIYSGALIPCEAFGYPTDKEFLSMAEKVRKLEEEFTEGLSEKQKEEYDNIQKEKMLLNTMDTDRMFEFAFKLGFRLSREIFDD